METILSLLHYQTLEAHDRLDPRALAAVAIQSDKYDCTRALRPWISLWSRNVSETSDTEELGFSSGCSLLSPSFGELHRHICSHSQTIEGRSRVGLGRPRHGEPPSPRDHRYGAVNKPLPTWKLTGY